MWGSLGINVKGFVGAALENVQKLSQDLEAEMNAAVSSNENDQSLNSTIKEDKLSANEEIPQEISSYINAPNEDNLESVIVDDTMIQATIPVESEKRNPSPEKKSRKVKKSSSQGQVAVASKEVFSAPVTPSQPVNTPEPEPESSSQGQVAIAVVSKELFSAPVTPSVNTPEPEPESSSQGQVAIAAVSKEVFSAPATPSQPVNTPEPEPVMPIRIDDKGLLETEVVVTHVKDVNDQPPTLENQDRSNSHQSAQPPASDPPPQVKKAEKSKTKKISKTKENPNTIHLEPSKGLPRDEPHFVADSVLVPPEIVSSRVPDVPLEGGSASEHNIPIQVDHEVEVKNENSKLSETTKKVQQIEIKVEESNKHYFERKIENLTHEISHLTSRHDVLEKENKSLRAELVEKDRQFTAANTKLSTQMKNEMDRLSEVISERERALQTANIQLSDLHRQNEELTNKLSMISSEFHESKQLIKQLQVTAVGENECKKEILKLQEILREKEESLSAYASEGQALSKKQGEMEKIMKKLRQESREKDGEITKLKEARDQLLTTIEELKEVIRQNETNSNNLQKQISVLQSVSQSSQDKITKLESELSLRIDELASQRKALETSWNDNNDLKRSIAELQAECDSLKSQIGLGENKAWETESSRRDLEQREAILRATNRQLQENLQRQMAESTAREERMREELKETRNRWQEAIASREALASEVGNATTPLLRQITSLQETLRVKTDTWHKLENNLSERTLRAEKMVEIAENKRNLLEEEIQGLRQQYNLSQSKVHELTESNHNYEMMIERYKKNQIEYEERINKFTNQLNEETSHRISLENTLHDHEYQKKRFLEQINEENKEKFLKYDLEIKLLKNEIEQYKEKIQQTSSLMSSTNTSGNNNPTSGNSKNDNKKMKHVQSSNYTPVEQESFAISEKSHQTLLHKDEKIEYLSKQLQQAETSRDALLEEVSYLSSKLSSYEEKTSMNSIQSFQMEITKLKEQNETLLILLGEKEEELENLLLDIKDIKNLYQNEMNRLITENCSMKVL